MTLVNVSWYHTEEFSGTIEMPDDFDIEADDADEEIKEVIANMDQEELTGYFDGCTAREITEKEVTI